MNDITIYPALAIALVLAFFLIVGTIITVLGRAIRMAREVAEFWRSRSLNLEEAVNFYSPHATWHPRSASRKSIAFRDRGHIARAAARGEIVTSMIEETHATAIADDERYARARAAARAEDEALIKRLDATLRAGDAAGLVGSNPSTVNVDEAPAEAVQ